MVLVDYKRGVHLPSKQCTFDEQLFGVCLL